MKTVPTFRKKKSFDVRRVVTIKFRLLLEFYWVSSGGKNTEFFIVRRVVAKLLLFVSSGDGRGWWG